MISALWAVLTAWAAATGQYGSEVGVSDYAGRPTVLLCLTASAADNGRCWLYALDGGRIVSVEE